MSIDVNKKSRPSSIMAHNKLKPLETQKDMKEETETVREEHLHR